MGGTGVLPSPVTNEMRSITGTPRLYISPILVLFHFYCPFVLLYITCILEFIFYTMLFKLVLFMAAVAVFLPYYLHPDICAGHIPGG
jgi:hypothetical protein